MHAIHQYCMHGLEISPGGLKTSNQFYGLVLAPRNLTVQLEVHEHKLVQSFHEIHTVMEKGSVS